MEDLILVVNCSSSLFKATILNSRSGDIVLSCLAAKLGQADAYITFNRRGNRSTISLAEQPDHHGAAAELLEETRILGIERRIRAIGHRVVHGGDNPIIDAHRVGIMHAAVHHAVADGADAAPDAENAGFFQQFWCGTVMYGLRCP